MNMSIDLNVKQTQILSPQMIQSMEILQMGVQELLEYVDKVVQENPVLEADESATEGVEYVAFRQKMDWLESTDTQNLYFHKQDCESEENEILEKCNGTKDEDTLYAYALSQLETEKMDSELKKAVNYLLENLDSKGYLDESLADLASDLMIKVDVMETALHIIQNLEPAGIGARNLSECLCLQLKRMPGDTGLAQEISKNYLRELSKNYYNLIAKELNFTLDDVREACSLIRTLNPKPGAGYFSGEQTTYIIPDIIVSASLDHFEILSNDCFFPRLKLSSYYKNLIGETEEQEIKDYLNEKIRHAKWVVKSIEQRKSTLMSCSEYILDVQEEFFRYGPGHLVPMSLADIANAVGVHESTVSRAVKGKYIQCHFGVYQFSYFFSRSLKSTKTQQDYTADNAKALLKKIIDDEDKKKPISDQKLCALLIKRGCELSRRTVAKYRCELGIPAAAGRRAC